MPRKKITPEEPDQAMLAATTPAESAGTDAPITDAEPAAPAPKGKRSKKKDVPPPPEDIQDTPQDTDEGSLAPHEDSEAGPLGSAENAPVEQSSSPDEEAVARKSPRKKPPQAKKSERQQFFDLQFNELDRDLTDEERREWNAIYASFRGRSVMSGTIIGIDPLSINVSNKETGRTERQTMYCAIVVPYRVRVVIPSTEMWERDHARPDFVLQNMVGANIDFIIIKVDRENGFAIGSRRLAARADRYFLSHRPALQAIGTKTTCKVLSVGPRRCLVECYGHDLNLTQRELRYTAIPDLREVYHPGMELDCIIKGYDPDKDELSISVKETEPNPFDGAEVRHPVGSRRKAVIAGKYGGGVFCNLPDDTVCMCSYAYHYQDSDFTVGDTVILAVQRFEHEKKQMYGKILTKW